MIATVTLWLLVSVGNGRYGAGATPTQVVERFHEVQECERVRQALVQGSSSDAPRLHCVQARVWRP